MAKSVYVVGGLGLGACMVLSLVMQHLLEISEDSGNQPVVREIQERFGSRLERECVLQVRVEDGRTVVRLVVFPDPEIANSVFAQDIGRVVWGRYDSDKPLDAVEIEYRLPDWKPRLANHDPRVIPVPPPFMALRGSAPAPAAPPARNQPKVPPKDDPKVDSQAAPEKPGRTPR